MTEGFHSLTGRWIGRFDYGMGGGVAFEAELIEQDGQISGRTAEANAFRADQGHTLVAQLQGDRAGLAVQFIKIYLGFDQGANPVYEGQADAGLTRIGGRWRFTGLRGGSGRFVMMREPLAAARRRRRARAETALDQSQDL